MESNIQLKPHQVKALEKLHSGAILCGGVGTGKTLTSLYYYKKYHSDKKLYVITTAKKRDDDDWYKEAKLANVDIEYVDSWNNIQKYKNINNSFFIFDEQRVVGYGKWATTFIKISKNNKWILLTATPGDRWIDYVAVFIANGYYKNITDFRNQHVEYNKFISFPSIKRYHNVSKLETIRDDIVVTMPLDKSTKRVDINVTCSYDTVLYRNTLKNRWNYKDSKPIENASQLVHLLRRVTDSDDKRKECKVLLSLNDKVIVFYNYNYELESIIDVCKSINKPYFQWNGHAHQQIPLLSEWVYIVQYTSGSEGWNCIETDTMIFYSNNHSWKIMEQAHGRIDRMNTKYSNLYYYHLLTNSSIDISIEKALELKKEFNSHIWVKENEKRI